MNRLLRHAAAAARRTVRQVARSRLLLRATAGAATLCLALLPDIAEYARVVGAAAMTMHFALVATTAGVPGDDLASGALANDLLAGTSPLAIVLGAVAGALLAAVPPALAVVGLAGPRLFDAPAQVIAVALGLALLGSAAMASMAVALGTILPGRAATVPLLIVVVGGEVPPSFLPLERYPPAIAEFVRDLWGILPLPHHVRAGVGAMALDHPVAPHLLPLLFGTIAAVAVATLVLRIRITTGRWS